MDTAQDAHYLLTIAPPDQQMPFVFILLLIQKECEYIGGKIDELGRSLCLLQIIYPNIVNNDSIEVLVAGRKFSSIICSTIDKICNPYLVRPELEQHEEHSIATSSSNRYISCFHTTINHCISFFNSMIPAGEPSNEIPYPYNRTRVRI
jgi:hypothetical protein